MSSAPLVEQTAICLMRFETADVRERFLAEMTLLPCDLMELYQRFMNGKHARYPSACVIRELIEAELARRGYSIGAETMREVGNGE